MLDVDGSQKSGSGTILRLSLALSGILGESLHIYNIRRKRFKPGLRFQHLEAVLTAAKICEAKVEGATLNSQEILFEPSGIKGGKIYAEIGTAGSIPLLIMTILPICAFAKQPVDLTITSGGTDTRHSPTINYLRYILLPVLEDMNLKIELEVNKYGYYPKGMGEVNLKVQPIKELLPFNLDRFGSVKKVNGISVCTFLTDRRVAERQSKEAERLLTGHGYPPKIQVIDDFSNPKQKGSSIVLWAKTNTGVILGGDAIGEIHKSSELVGREAAQNLLDEILAEATVDIHLADMLIPFIALATGKSKFITRKATAHLISNIWLVSTILGTEFGIEKKKQLYLISKK